jgi:putative hemolysin
MEILIIFLLTLLNGFFALSEIALVSVKKSRIEQLSTLGNRKALEVKKLLENPENFLSSVQVGITLIGIIAGAYGGATLAKDLEIILLSWGIFGSYVPVISYILVIGGITYFTIVIGELVPKTIAMNNAEKIALFSVPIIKYFTLATYPFVKLLSVSTNVILKVLGIRDNSEEKITEDELRYLLKSARMQGVLEKEESEVHHNLFSFTDQTAKSLLTHRSEVEWINLKKDKQAIFDQIKESVHSKFVVSSGDLDNVKGVITIKRFLENYTKEDFKWTDIIEEPIFITQNTSAFKILNLFKKKRQYIGIVVDEYGSIRGIITLHDLIEAIVGDLPDEDETDGPNIFRRTDGTYLIEGRTLIYEINQYFQRQVLENNINKYTTISGFILSRLNDIPKAGDIVDYGDYRFEVVDIDGVRIDKILMTPVEA